MDDATEARTTAAATEAVRQAGFPSTLSRGGGQLPRWRGIKGTRLAHQRYTERRVTGGEARRRWGADQHPLRALWGADSERPVSDAQVASTHATESHAPMQRELTIR